MGYMRFAGLMILALLAGTLVGCAPKQFVSPDFHSVLFEKSAVGPDEIAVDQKRMTIGETPGKILNYVGGWLDAREMTWFESNKIAFVKEVDRKTKEKIYYIYDTVAAQAYRADDEYTISRIDDHLKNTTISFNDVTDKNNSLGGQIFKAILKEAGCNKKDVSKQGRITSPGGDIVYDFFRIDHMKGQKVKGAFGITTCNWTVESSDCYFRKPGASDGEQTRVPCVNGRGISGFITEDETLFITPSYVYDLRNERMLFGPLLVNNSSKPPILLNYALSPGLDKVALLYGTPDSYFIDVMNVALATAAGKAAAGEEFVGDGVNKPIKSFTNLANRPNAFGVENGTLEVYANRFEFRCKDKTCVLPFNEITKVGPALMSKGVIIKTGEQKLNIHGPSFQQHGFFPWENAASDLKKLASGG